MSQDTAQSLSSQNEAESKARLYRTTRPIIPPSTSRRNLQITSQSSRGSWDLELRPFQAADLPDFRKLRTQHEVMKWTSIGTIDATMSETEFWMNRFLPPKDLTSYQFSIFIHKAGNDYEHVGVIGCHILYPVAEIGYMLRQEWWGYGLATGAVMAFIQSWWTLERQVVSLEYGPHREHSELEANKGADDSRQSIVEEIVEGELSKSSGEDIVPEVLIATIVDTNIGSKRVLKKCGFKYRKRTEVEENGEMIGLEFFTLTRQV